MQYVSAGAVTKEKPLSVFDIKESLKDVWHCAHMS